MNPNRRIRRFYDQFISLKGEPESIALGVALGIFIGVTPTIPFHTALIIVLTFVLKENFTAAYLGSWLISNPLTIPFFYFTQYRLGKYLLGNGSLEIVFNDYSVWQIIHMGWCVAHPLLIGGLIMAPFFAVPAYFITLKAVIAIRKKREISHK